MIDIIRVGCVLLVGIRFGVAQTPPPTPHEPFLAKLPANTSWVMHYEKPAADPATVAPQSTTPGAAAVAPPTILNVTVVRNNGLRREVTQWSDQSLIERWIVKNIIFTQHKTGGPFGITSAELAGIASTYPDFPQLVWIDKEHFKSVEEKDGKSSFLYVWSESGFGLRSVDSPLPVEPTKVWVSVETNLPVAMEDAHFKVTFEFDQPVTTLTLPAQCRSLLAELANTNKRLDGQQMIRPQ